MQKLLLSLDKDIARRELFFSQADSQGFTVFPALNTMQENWQNLTALFDVNAFQNRYGRVATKGEIGCTLSHLAMYEQLLQNEKVAEQEFCLICEDDVLFAPHFNQYVETLVQQNIQADIVLVGQSKIPQFNDQELEIVYPTTFSFLAKAIANTPYYYAYPYKPYYAGTVAYLIRKSAIRKFLQYLKDNKPFWLADDFILFSQLFHSDALVLRPLLAIENPQLASNLAAQRDISAVNSGLIMKLAKYPLKKILAILRNLQG